MSKSPLKAHSAVSEQAAAWLIKMDGDKPLSKKEMKELGEWLHRSPIHRSELESLCALWSDNVLTELMLPLSQYDASAEEPAAEEKGFFKRPSVRWGAMAACALCICALLFLNFLPNKELGDGNGIYSTSIGEQKTLSLPDGSTILLNTNSKLEVSYAESHRNIYLLTGEAYFDVAKNPARPFRVYAGGGRIQAIGTAFSVHVQKSDVSVMVSEGSVAFAPLQQALADADDVKGDAKRKTGDREPTVVGSGNVLSAGESGTIALPSQQPNSEAKVTKKTIPSSELFRKHSWRNGYLTFSGESLEEAMQEVSRYTTMSIEISEPEVASIPIGGRFKFNEMEKMFDILEQGFGVNVHRVSENKVQLSSIKE
ncbi:FecR domain-containing protein [Porticoccus sp. W117]|uniref:FecR family protein n=1 Tax=Porticoccus sp. W117 TaxID=3054777 RepID=UPI00259200A7|nr:FecR domain-containing protein [Porticoccus sp. W117]MDM3872272.1 FecR domain-containing protein [Porticoccus sp. W117]